MHRMHFGFPRLATWPVLATLEQRTRLELLLVDCVTEMEKALEGDIRDSPSVDDVATATWNLDRCVAQGGPGRDARRLQQLSWFYALFSLQYIVCVWRVRG
jgi:hypothetical protein